MKSRIVYLMLCVGLFSCGKKTQLPDASTDYAVITVQPSTSDLNTSYPATIKGKQDIEIRPKISGFITQLCVDEGSFVRKGQPLFIIDRVQYEEAVKTASAAVRVAEANVNTQRLTVNNKKELNKKQIISNYDLEMAQNTLASYEAQLASARAQLIQARNNLSFTTITSPSDGVVGAIPFRVGSLVSSSSTEPLTIVSNISEMFVYFSMTEKQLLDLTRETGGIKAAIAKMPEVKLRLSDGTIYEQTGRISTVSGVIDQSTGSVNMRATFHNPNNVLRSGGTGSILVPSVSNSAIQVPQKATYEIQDKKFVYVVGKDNKVKSTAITVSELNNGTTYVVLSGLNIGERIVIDGVSTLKDGMQIKPITPEQAVAARKQAQKDIAEGKMPF